MIKTYSPNLMVHPLMRQSPSPTASEESSTCDSADTVASRIIDMLPRLHVLVIGPGLGRDPLMQDTVTKVVEAARKQNMPVVLDADALQVVQRRPALVRGYKLAVLTPNVVEFGRLCKALGIEEEEEEEEVVVVQKKVDAADGKDKSKGKEAAKVEALARALDGVTIVQKGFKDLISDGETTLTVDLTGGKKRSGGQGDTLTGSIATFLGWRKAYLDGLWDHGGKLQEADLVRLACFGGCAVTRVSSVPFFLLLLLLFFLKDETRERRREQAYRSCPRADCDNKECSRNAFNKKGRSLQASDLTDEVHTSFLNLFGEEDPDAGGAKL